MADHEPAVPDATTEPLKSQLECFISRLDLDIRAEELENMSDEDLMQIVAEAESEPPSAEMLEVQARVFKSLGITPKSE